MLKNMQSQRYQGLMKMKVGTLLLCGKALHQPRLRSKVERLSLCTSLDPTFQFSKKTKNEESN